MLFVPLLRKSTLNELKNSCMDLVFIFLCHNETIWLKVASRVEKTEVFKKDYKSYLF